MERRFFWPVAIAAALHAGLPLVIRRGDAPAPVAEVFKLLVGDPPPPVTEVPPPEEHEYVEKVAKGSPVEPPPQTPEPLVTKLDPTVFEIPVPTVERTTFDRRTIPVGPTGDPRGDDGPGLRGPKFDLSHLDNKPRTRAQPAPQYPFEAKRSGMQGEVLVEFTVDESGNVLDPHVVNSTDAVFEQATLRAVSKWRFEPGMRGGRPVRFKMSVPVKFNLNDSR